ncbi:S-layer homology domain-containing protein [Paenibacillus sp. WQ 127069]|uniref:S-layer homology domain-containing protein n=1 Tax=Paenibacillus baimaensis TaxID=2982185 RepID=A0ABT2UGH2_9BACL|nr:S-layer homology domain-containing protein [Paenibacillus sp. WQ 127069]MCU6793724.1 S-layer homology domain-containing protein [Paenibacillus sp. WQ 127069]
MHKQLRNVKFLCFMMVMLSFVEFAMLPPAYTYANNSSELAIQSLATGFRESKVVRQDGTVWAWGANEDGRLGDGTTDNKLYPIQLKGVTDTVEVTSGQSFTVALHKDGTVWSWGWNIYGQLGDGTTENKSSPIQVSGLTDVTAISSGAAHTLALKSDGTVWAWGWNQYGQLGVNITDSKLVPVQVEGLTDVTAISSGLSDGAAVKRDGTVWVWGNNRSAESSMGTLGSEEWKSVPVQLSGLTNVVAVAEGKYTTAVKRDGTVWAWRWNQNGKNENKTVPFQVKGLKDIIAVSGGRGHNLALNKDGTVWAWGGNFTGQLGDGTTDERTDPIRVSDLTDIIAVTASSADHNLALRKDGTVWAWGANEAGQLGDGSTESQRYPVQVNFAGGDGKPALIGGATFNDVTGHWAESMISWAYANKVIDGYQDGSFKPDNNVSEAEFLAIFLKMFGVQAAGSNNHWADAFYTFSEAHHFPIQGIGNAAELRSAFINRETVAGIIAAADGTHLLKDEAIQYLLDKGYSSGKTSATVVGYKGRDLLTRAEAIQFVKNVKDKGMTLK